MGDVAVRVEFENGKVEKAKLYGQVMISAGAYRTPQILP